MSLTIEERTTSLVDFLVRLAGIVGGILVCSSYAWRGTLNGPPVVGNLGLADAFCFCSWTRGGPRRKEAADRTREQRRRVARREGGTDTFPNSRKGLDACKWLPHLVPVGLGGGSLEQYRQV